MKDIITRIIDELVNRLNDSDWEPITLTMKPSGETVRVTPCFYGSKDPNQVEFFLLDSTAMNMCGCDNWQDLAHTLLDFEKDRLASIDSKRKCNAFYEKSIKPYSNEEIHKGNEYFEDIYRAWDCKTGVSLSDFMDSFCFADIAKDNDSPERVKELVQLSMNLDTYSDWYKDLYGHRP